MIDILQVFEAEGITLRRRGKEYIGICVFHPDKHPSLSVNQDKGLYHCPACGAGGDAITFIMKYRGFTFPEAKKYLGLDDGKDDLDIAVERERAKTRKAFRDWCEAEERRLMNLTIDTYEIMNKVKDFDHIELFADDIRNLSLFEHNLDILVGKNDSQKLSLYKQALAHAGR